MFKPVSQKVDFVALEHEINAEWIKNKTIEKYLKKNDQSDKRFSFFDGPITANNPMGVHHAWGRMIKDLYQRYKNMQGYKQRFQNGFDCQGLWVEVEVEKELGFKSKKDIETYGIDTFVEKCKERVRKYSNVQTEQSKRLGYFMDWDHSYYTMADENNYMIWHFLKVCHQKGFLYKGWDSVPWCPRCGTAISQHEILTEEYKEVTHASIYCQFPIVSRKPKFSGAHLLIWTTTPWTLAANVAVAVAPDLDYVKVKSKENGKAYILAKSMVSVIRGEYATVSEFKGEDLVGLEYKGPYDELPAWKNIKGYKHHVVSWDEVGEQEGTGLVHIAPGCGAEDYELSKVEMLPPIVPIDEAGNYVDGFDWLSGRNVKQATDDIFTDLEKKGFTYYTHPYTHRYPTCWRCKEELLFRLVEEWYIAMDRPDPADSEKRTLREKMIDVTKRITWIPDFGLERELDWLVNMHDWLISKKRYWGLALPIYPCECGHVEVIGSYGELQKRAVEGWEKFKGKSPHRPWVDAVKIACEKCGKTVSRITDVGNPWLDAGIISFSTLVDPDTKKVSYTSDKKYWENWFPADFVTESFPGQFKNWFYSMIAMSTVLEDTNPFKTLLGYALVRDEKGEEMHKSKGNAIWFDDAAEKIGVDVMRWMYALQNPTLNLNFGYSVADETRRRFHLMLWNVYNFFLTYATLSGWKPKEAAKKETVRLIDTWILEKLKVLIAETTKNLEHYNHHVAAVKIEEFIVGDLSTWYVRRIKKRVGPGNENASDTHAVYATLYTVLTTVCRLLAPFVPYLSDALYKNLTDEESVHLASWPEKSVESVKDDLLKQMEFVRQIVEAGHAQRKEKGIKVRQPLKKITIKSKNLSRAESREEKIKDKELLVLLKDELNVKDVLFEKSKIDEISVELDTTLTSALLQEGTARELMRLIQDMRKELGCAFSDKIETYWQGSGEIEQTINRYSDEIKTQTLSSVFEKGTKEKLLEREKEIDGNKVWLGIRIT